MDDIWLAQANVPRQSRDKTDVISKEARAIECSESVADGFENGTDTGLRVIKSDNESRELGACDKRPRARISSPLPHPSPPESMLDNETHSPKLFRLCDDVDFIGGYDSCAETFAGADGEPTEQQLADMMANATTADESLDESLTESSVGILDKVAHMYRRTRDDINALFGCSVGCSGKVLGGRSVESRRPRTFEISFEDIEELNFLGSGATACVFLGIYNEEKVAVKKFKDVNPTLMETRQIRSLSHENIVRFLGVCTKPPVYCIVMEYCPKSLHEIIKDTRIPPTQMCEYARQIANGMQYLHSKSQVHRDLKSPNVLMAQDGNTLKISDFGTARSFGTKSTTMSFCGSVAWMSPEMVRSEPCTQKVDVWSYGVVLWELLTGEIPYQGVDQGAIIYGIGTESLHLPVPTTAPLGFSLLLKQCWNAHAKHRPEFRQILLHLEILQDDDEFAVSDDKYFETQRSWQREMTAEFEKMKQEEKEMRKMDQELIERREEELQHAQDVRQLYEARLHKVSQLIAELKQRERDVELRERQLKKRSKARTTGRRSYAKAPSRRRSKEYLWRKRSGTVDEGIESGRESSRDSTRDSRPNMSQHSDVSVARTCVEWPHGPRSSNV